MQIKPYLYLMRLDRPIGTLLLLWPTLISLWLSSRGHPNYKTLIIFVLGVIIMRAAGCVINDYADRDFDSKVTRTQNRPLATGEISPKSALNLFIALMIMAFILTLQLRLYTILLSIVGAGLAILYPFTKRFTGYPQLVLSLAFAWSVPMVYAEVLGQVNVVTWLLYVSIMCWVVAYDTQYAMADKTDDLKIGLKSTAISFGDKDKLIIFGLQLLAIVGLSSLGAITSLGISYYFGLALAFCLVLYQQWLIKDRDPKLCYAAFLNNNYFGIVIFIGLVINYYKP